MDLLRPELVSIPAPWRSFDATVTGLVDLICAQDGLAIADASRTVQAVVSREAEAPTTLLEIGVGIPHARLAGLAQPALAIAIAPGGLYEPVPLLRVEIVALVLSPLTAFQSHLETLAGLSLLFRSAELRAALLQAHDASAALALLSAQAHAPR